MKPTSEANTARVTTPLWLSHHPPEQHDRCLSIGPWHLCRRCSVLYPVSFAVLALALATGRTDSSLDLWLFALLPLPAVVEWWLEHLHRIGYSPVRQMLTSLPLGVALGVGFARYLHDPGDPAFWGMVIVYGGACGGIALWQFLDERAP